jgi:hypothetical protein
LPGQKIPELTEKQSRFKHTGAPPAHTRFDTWWSAFPQISNHNKRERDPPAAYQKLFFYRYSLFAKIADNRANLFFIAIINLIDVLHPIQKIKSHPALGTHLGTANMIGIEPGLQFFHEILQTALFHYHPPIPMVIVNY